MNPHLKVTQLYYRHRVLFFASHYSQDYDGDVRTCLHAGFIELQSCWLLVTAAVYLLVL
jgi:hypothetical protein